MLNVVCHNFGFLPFFFFCGEMIRRQLTGNFAQLCGCIEVGKVRVVVTLPQPHLEVS